MSDFIIVEAILRLKKTEDGGRYSGIKTGYRPNHVFEYNRKGNFDMCYIGEIQFEKEWILPGEQDIVTVLFMSNKFCFDFLKVGLTWWIHEGKKLVGEAEIIKIN